MKAEEILDKIETQLEEALDCYNKASDGGSDTDLEKKKYHAQQLLGLVRTLRAEDQQLPRASRFKQVSEIAMDVEIEAAKERNERLRKEIERIGREQREVKYAKHIGKLKTLLDELRGNMINDDVIETIIKKLTK